MVNNLLILTEQRLDRIKQEQLRLRRAMLALEKQQHDIQTRIDVLSSQSALFDLAAELTREAFFERQRHKAALLAEIARLLYQLENSRAEHKKLQQGQSRIKQRLREANSRCEKFRSYLKQQRINQRLKWELQQQYEIEELSTNGGHKTSK